MTRTRVPARPAIKAREMSPRSQVEQKAVRAALTRLAGARSRFEPARRQERNCQGDDDIDSAFTPMRDAR